MWRDPVQNSGRLSSIVDFENFQVEHQPLEGKRPALEVLFERRGRGRNVRRRRAKDFLAQFYSSFGHLSIRKLDSAATVKVEGGVLLVAEKDGLLELALGVDLRWLVAGESVDFRRDQTNNACAAYHQHSRWILGLVTVGLCVLMNFAGCEWFFVPRANNLGQIVVAQTDDVFVGWRNNMVVFLQLEIPSSWSDSREEAGAAGRGLSTPTRC
ncbi:hypothetical protein HYQ46_012305 [Verticillium longisporum]|nr:hypothetical protein HYQ46_012305 [Verticillium longisporum]